MTRAHILSWSNVSCLNGTVYLLRPTCWLMLVRLAPMPTVFAPKHALPVMVLTPPPPRRGRYCFWGACSFTRCPIGAAGCFEVPAAISGCVGHIAGPSVNCSQYGFPGDWSGGRWRRFCDGRGRLFRRRQLRELVRLRALVHVVVAVLCCAGRVPAGRYRSAHVGVCRHRLLARPSCLCFDPSIDLLMQRSALKRGKFVFLQQYQAPGTS